MEAYRDLYWDQLSEKPKRMLEKKQSGYSKHLGWVYVCNNFQESKSVRTYQSLFAASEAYTYYTPNTFYRNDVRHAGSLRWLNALVVDIDVKHGKQNYLVSPDGSERVMLRSLTVPDIQDRITEAGLPIPSMIVSTPSGGFHVYWYLASPRRALPSVTKLYNHVQRMVATAIGGDVQAIGAERWFRMPTEANTVFYSNNRVSFDDLCVWFQEEQESIVTVNRQVCFDVSNLMHHPAILKLLEGVSEGQRDNSCYTLALAMKASGYEVGAAEQTLYAWNERNDPAMLQIDIKRKVRSAYKPGAPAGPSAYWIHQLSGIRFTYQVWETAKTREERTYSHYEEWAADILAYLQSEGGEVSDSQRKIAAAIYSSADEATALSYSSFKKVIEWLVQRGKITKQVTGKGRGAVTTITLVKQPKVVPLRRKNGRKINGLNSNTFIDQVVGGHGLSMYRPTYLSRRNLFPGGNTS